MATSNRWRQTVRDIYDICHFTKATSSTIVYLIEKRHPRYFVDAGGGDDWLEAIYPSDTSRGAINHVGDVNDMVPSVMDARCSKQPFGSEKPMITMENAGALSAPVMLSIAETTDGTGLNVIVDGRYAALFPIEQREQVEWLVERMTAPEAPESRPRDGADGGTTNGDCE